MFLKKNLNYFIIICLLAVLTMPIIVYGRGLVPCGTSETEECTLCDLLRLGQNIIVFLRNVGLALAALFTAWGGFLLLTSGESEERRAKGKDTLKTAIIGVIIILASWIIINTILTFAAAGGDLPKVLYNWSSIKCQ